MTRNKAQVLKYVVLFRFLKVGQKRNVAKV